MNPTYDQVRMVKQDWSTLRNVQPHIIGDVFYSKLFFDYPQMKSSFVKLRNSVDPSDPNEALVHLIGSVVSRLDAPDDLRRVLEIWIVNIQSPVISPSVFVKLSDSLIWTLKKAFGSQWNPEKEMAWAACIGIVGLLIVKS